MYFTALAEELTTALDKVTEDFRRVFRVDLRLRPHGSAGPLVGTPAQKCLIISRPKAARGTLRLRLKARAVAGDLNLGRNFLGSPDRLSASRYLSLEAIGEMKALKSGIELRVSQRGETDGEVKLGAAAFGTLNSRSSFCSFCTAASTNPCAAEIPCARFTRCAAKNSSATPKSSRSSSRTFSLRNVEHRLQLHRRFAKSTCCHPTPHPAGGLR